VTDAYPAFVDDLAVGEAHLRNVAVTALDFSDLGQYRDAKAVGLLGFDFVASAVVHIDYDRHAVSLTPFDAFRPPADAIQLPVKLGSLVPTFPVIIENHYVDGFVFDTAGGIPFMLTPGFHRRYPGVGTYLRGTELVGIGGRISAEWLLIRSIRIGPIDLKGYRGMLVSNDAAYPGLTTGVLGSEFISNFNVDLDYVDATIYLTPNTNARRNRAR
jgi:hypothetical protein